MQARSLVPWCVLLLAAGCGAEEPPFRVYTTADGLVRNWLTKITRDSAGNLWFASMEGLSLFDGQRFKNYLPKDGLPDRLVNDILEVARGEYWLATKGGLCRLRPRAWRNRQTREALFEPIPLEAGSKQPSVDCLARAGEFIWMGSDADLYRVRIRDRVPERVEFGDNSAIRAVLADHEGAVWIGTDKGVYRRTADGQTEAFARATIRALLEDHLGRIWAGGEGLFGYRLDGGRPVLVFFENDPAFNLREDIQSLHETADGSLWIGTLGLVRFRPDTRDPGARLRRYTFSGLLRLLYAYGLEEDS